MLASNSATSGCPDGASRGLRAVVASGAWGVWPGRAVIDSVRHLQRITPVNGRISSSMGLGMKSHGSGARKAIPDNTLPGHCFCRRVDWARPWQGIWTDR